MKDKLTNNALILVTEDTRIIGCNNNILVLQRAHLRVFGDNNKISVMNNGVLLSCDIRGSKNRMLDNNGITIQLDDKSVTLTK